MSIITQYDDDQSSGVLISIWECGNVYRRVEKGNKERWYYGFCGNEYNIWNSKRSVNAVAT